MGKCTFKLKSCSDSLNVIQNASLPIVIFKFPFKVVFLTPKRARETPAKSYVRPSVLLVVQGTGAALACVSLMPLPSFLHRLSSALCPLSKPLPFISFPYPFSLAFRRIVAFVLHIACPLSAVYRSYSNFQKIARAAANPPPP